MEVISAAMLQRNLGEYQDRALIEPVIVTRNGRERIVILNVAEYYRLKSLDRRTLAASDLSDEEIAEIASAEPTAEAASFDHEVADDA